MTTVRVVWLGAVVLVWADGVLDGAVVADLHTAVDGLLAGEPQTVVLDLSGVIAVDDGAAAVLVAAAAALSHAGVALELRLPGGRAVTIAGATQLREVLTSSYPPEAR